jgi:hypothetical protein
MVESRVTHDQHAIGIALRSWPVCDVKSGSPFFNGAALRAPFPEKAVATGILWNFA